MATHVPPPKKQREAPPALDQTPTVNLDKKAPQELETLNFKVTAEFKRQYKGYAVARGKQMIDLLRESFDLYREKYGS